VNSYSRHAERVHAHHQLLVERWSEKDDLQRNLISDFDHDENTVGLKDVGKNSEPLVGNKSRDPIDLLELVNFVNQYLTDFVLRLREKHILPGSVSKEISQDVNTIICSALGWYSNIVNIRLQQESPASIDSWSDILNTDDSCASIGQHIVSEYRMLRHLRDYSKVLVEPVEIILNTDRPHETFQYVPLNSVLAAFLNHDDILSTLRNQLKANVPKWLIFLMEICISRILSFKPIQMLCG